MRIKFCFLTTAVFLLLLACHEPACADPINISASSLSDADKNRVMLLTSSTHDLLAMGIIFGGDPDTVLSITGTFNSDSFVWNLDGSYRGLPLTLSYSGGLTNADTGSWTGTGTFGTSSWTATGTALFFNDSAALTSTGVIGNPDSWAVGLSITIKNGDVSGGGSGTYSGKDGDISVEVETADGQITGTIKGETPLDKDEDEGTKTTIEGEVEITPPNNLKVNVMVKEEPIPEPTTLLLLGTGLAGVVIKTRKKLKSRKSE